MGIGERRIFALLTIAALLCIPGIGLGAEAASFSCSPTAGETVLPGDMVDYKLTIGQSGAADQWTALRIRLSEGMVIDQESVTVVLSSELGETLARRRPSFRGRPRSPIRNQHPVRHPRRHKRLRPNMKSFRETTVLSYCSRPLALAMKYPLARRWTARKRMSARTHRRRVLRFLSHTSWARCLSLPHCHRRTMPPSRPPDRLTA